MSTEKAWENLGISESDKLPDIPQDGAEVKTVPVPEGYVPVYENGVIVRYELPDAVVKETTDPMLELFKQKAENIASPEQVQVIQEIMADAPYLSVDTAAEDTSDIIVPTLDYDDEDTTPVHIPEPSIEETYAAAQPKEEAKQTLANDATDVVKRNSLDDTWKMVLENDDDENETEENGLNRAISAIQALPVIDYGVNEERKNILSVKGRPIEVTAKQIFVPQSEEDFFKRFGEMERKVRDKIAAPLINSGICATVRGCGLLALADVYDIPEENVTLDYAIKKYNTMMDAITSVTPRIQGSELPKLMYWKDYDILSWAFVCATIDRIEHMVPCQKKQSELFRITGSPIDLLEMDDELIRRMKEIEHTSAKEIDSLVNRTVSFKDEFGTEITLRHPNYKKGNATIKEIKNIVQAEAEGSVFRDMASNPVIIELLMYMDDVNYLNSLKAATVRSQMHVLRNLSEDAMRKLMDLIEIMMKDVYEYKFSFRDIPCPICGELHTYKVDKIDTLVFQSRRLMPLLMEIERRQKLSGDK